MEPDELGAINSSIQQLNSIGNTQLQMKNNRKNREYVDDQNRRNRNDQIAFTMQQRKWALDDWEKVAQYNSPQEQMNRLKQAGLNPHLVYGNGADAQMSPIRDSGGQAPQGQTKHDEPIRIQGQENIIMDYAALQARGMQTDLMQQQARLIQEQAEKVELEKYLLGENIRDKTFKNDLQIEQRDQILLEQSLKNEKTSTDINATNTRLQYEGIKIGLQKRQLDLQAAKTAADVAKIDQEILTEVVKRNYTGRQQEMLLKQMDTEEFKQQLLKMQEFVLHNPFKPGSPEYIDRHSIALRCIIEMMPK